MGALMLCAPSDGSENERAFAFQVFAISEKLVNVAHVEFRDRAVHRHRRDLVSGAGGRIEHVTVEALIGLVAPEHDRLDGDAKVARIATVAEQSGDLNSLCSNAMVISRDAGAGMRWNCQSAMVRFHGGSFLPLTETTTVRMPRYGGRRYG